MRRLIVLGSTGSIGCSTLDVVAHLSRDAAGPRFEVVALSAHRNCARLAEQAAGTGASAVALIDSDAPFDGPADLQVYRGATAVCDLIDAVARPGDLVVAAIVGAAGLPPVMAAIERGCDIALANKETLVAAGSLVIPAARDRGVSILPVDSEHSALAQALRAGRDVSEVERMVLTASGGPFRTWSATDLARAKPADALAHPTWTMGTKVTIDSASLMNKALELIEAHWLFGLDRSRLDAIVHPQSIVHSFVEFIDGSVIAQLSPPDMRLPIQYALTSPARRPGCASSLDWATFSRLDFEPVDHDRFPAIRLAGRVMDSGGSSGAILNAANEVAVEAFLAGVIGFSAISSLVEATMDQLPSRPLSGLADCLEVDREARDCTRMLLPASASRLP